MYRIQVVVELEAEDSCLQVFLHGIWVEEPLDELNVDLEDIFGPRDPLGEIRVLEGDLP